GLQKATPILEERVIDTLLGTLIAIAIIVLIPTSREQQTLITHVQTFLNTLGATLRDSLTRLTNAGDGDDSFSSGPALDAAYQAIITSVTDARYEWGILHDQHDLEDNLLLVRALNILAKQLERETQRQPTLQDPQLCELFMTLGQHIDENARAISKAIADTEKNVQVSVKTFHDLHNEVMHLLDIEQSLTTSHRTQFAFPQMLFNLFFIDQLLT